MQVHTIKCHPKYFARIIDGSKTFEIRKNDRDYQVRDELVITEYDPEIGGELEEASFIRARVTYITDFAQTADYVVMGIKLIEINEI